MKFSKISSGLLLAYFTSLVQAISVELSPKNIKNLVGSGTWLIEHFSPHCPHCIAFAPVWKKLSDDLVSLEADNDFHFGTIDCLVQGDLCVEHGIQFYPTLQLWQNGVKIENFSGLKEYEPLKKYVHDKVKSLKSSVEIEELEGEVEDEEENEQELEEILEDEDVPEDEQENHVQVALPNSQGISVNLNGSKMKEISTGSIPWFVKFYSPSCSHCKALAPTWVKLASELRDQINVGEVNCNILRDVCTEYGIEGFPTLKMFGQGEEVKKYNGDRSLASLVEFANANSGPSVKQVTADELVKYLTVKDVALVYLHKGDIPELIESVAKEYISTIPFYASQDEELLKKFDLTSDDLPVVLITKDNSHRIYISPQDLSKNTKSNRDSLINWIEKEQYPLISKLGPSNHKSILQGNLPVVLNIVQSQDSVSQSKFRDFATAWFKTINPAAVIFAEMDRSMWKNYVLDKFGVIQADTSKVIIYDAPNYLYYTKDLNGNELSIDKPQELIHSLKNIERLSGGTSTLALYQKLALSTSNGFNWIFKHWFISFFVFSIMGSFIYRYLTLRGTTKLGNGILPSFRPVDSHKD